MATIVLKQDDICEAIALYIKDDPKLSAKFRDKKIRVTVGVKPGGLFKKNTASITVRTVEE